MNDNKYLFCEDARKSRPLVNMQGDVVAIYDESGLIVAEYVYDAWGNCVIISSVDGVAELNPIRYRGYYFDQETGLYYLKTRYYDPEVGRFVNMDDVTILDTSMEHINGLNLYAYCFNNCVNMVDNTGMWPEWLKTLVTIAIIAVVVVAVIAVTVLTAGVGTAIIGGIAGATFATTTAGVIVAMIVGGGV